MGLQTSILSVIYLSVISCVSKMKKIIYMKKIQNTASGDFCCQNEK